MFLMRGIPEDGKDYKRYNNGTDKHKFKYRNLSDTSNYPGHSFGQFSLF